MPQDKGQAYADRFKALLRIFPKEDGTPWRGTDLERASDGALSSSYITALRQGKIRRPGFEALSLIARIIQFDTELWTLDAEEFDKYSSMRSFGSHHPDLQLVDALEDDDIQQIVRKSVALSSPERQMLLKLLEDRRVLESLYGLVSSGVTDRV